MKSIIKYYREYAGTLVIQNDNGTVENKDVMVPRGCVVASGKKKVGWSFCNNKDNFCYKIARKIAFGRAEKSSERPSIKEGVPWELANLYTHVERLARETKWDKEVKS